MTTRIIRSTGTSTANAIGTASTTTGEVLELVMVTVAYSAAPTQAGVTTTLDSGAGAAYDTLLNTGTADARYTAFLPTAPIFIMADDQIDVSAPAGGAGITSAIAIYTKPA